MDREILFRGKRLDNGEWVEGYLIRGERTYIVSSDDVGYMVVDLSGMASLYPIDFSTVGQYTGLTDTKKHKAFVDDIVRYKNTHTVYGVIRFGEIKDTWGQSKHIGYYIEWQNSGANMRCDWWRRDLSYWLDDQHCEICGNIHDNPELIGGEGDG